MNKACGTVALIAAVITGGCVSMTKPMPEVKGQLAVVVSEDKASHLAATLSGFYHVPETSVYVSNDPAVARAANWLTVPMALLGPFSIFAGPVIYLGVEAVDVSMAKRKTGDPASLHIDIAGDADRILKEKLEHRTDPGHFAPSGGHAEATIEVIPYIFLTYVGKAQVRPWVMLDTRLKNSSGDEKWQTQYIASLDDPRPLAGENSWTSDDGEPLRNAIDRALRAGIDILLLDAEGHLARGKLPNVKVKGNWLGYMEPLEVRAVLLKQNPDVLVVQTYGVSDSSFDGINILDPHAVSVKSYVEKKR